LSPTGSHGWSREREDTNHTLLLTDPRSLSYQQVNTDPAGRYRITKTYTTDPSRTVGMDNNGGAGGSGGPTFFDGDTAGLPPANGAEHTKYMTFPTTHALNRSQASYDKSTGVISFQIPLSDVGAPSNGAALFSGTAFSATSTSPQSATTLFNLIDATTPFELVIGPPGTVGTTPTVGTGGGVSGGTGGSSHACPAPTGRLFARALGKLWLGMARSRARRLYPRFSTRGQRYTDFYCLNPIGIRASYPTPKVLSKLSRKVRRRLRGRLVLALTANSFYSLHGVHPGTPLRRAAKRLKAHRIKIGRNTWYVVPNEPSSGILKVQHGVIREVGIAPKALTPSRTASRLFLRNLRAR
jgi:hypothetical protein